MASSLSTTVLFLCTDPLQYLNHALLFLIFRQLVVFAARIWARLVSSKNIWSNMRKTKYDLCFVFIPCLNRNLIIYTWLLFQFQFYQSLPVILVIFHIFIHIWGLPKFQINSMLSGFWLGALDLHNFASVALIMKLWYDIYCNSHTDVMNAVKHSTKSTILFYTSLSMLRILKNTSVPNVKRHSVEWLDSKCILLYML